MSRLGLIKCAIVASWVIGAILLAAPGSLSKTYTARADSTQNSPVPNLNDYVGSDACMACHEEQFRSFSKTSHSRLAKANWKTERQGCESCHGPGKPDSLLFLLARDCQ